MTDPIPVRVCECPDGTHPEGDLVYLAPALSLEGGLQARYEHATSADGEELFRRWLRTFVRFGAVGWNFHDEQGEPVPFDVDVLLADSTLGLPVADAASDLYLDGVIGPLAKGSPKTSPGGPNGNSTSTRRTPTRKPRGSSSGARSAGQRSGGRTR